MIGSHQGRFDGFHLGRRHSAALKPAFGQQHRDLFRGFKILLRFIEVEDAAILAVKVDALVGRHAFQVFARFDRKPRGGDGVFLIFRDRGDELTHPRDLVP